MFKTVSLAVAIAGLLAAGAALQPSPVSAEPMTCREAAKLKFPGDRHSRVAYRKACKAAWKAHRLNPQPLPPKA